MCKNKVVGVLDDLQLCIASRLAILFLSPQKYFSLQRGGNDLDTEDPATQDT